jgi:hypothetical protein
MYTSPCVTGEKNCSHKNCWHCRCCLITMPSPRISDLTAPSLQLSNLAAIPVTPAHSNFARHHPRLPKHNVVRHYLTLVCSVSPLPPACRSHRHLCLLGLTIMLTPPQPRPASSVRMARMAPARHRPRTFLTLFA